MKEALLPRLAWRLRRGCLKWRKPSLDSCRSSRFALILGLGATLALGLSAILSGCDKAPSSGQARERLRVLCSSSMAAPMQELGKLFTATHDAQIDFDLGGSETLLPKILTGVPADLFVCHDPFEEKLKAAGRWTNTVVVGYLEPVVAVRPGNPKGLRRLEDLAQPGLKIGIGDPRYSTCGELFMEALQRRGLRDAVMKQVVLQSRSTTDVANGLVIGSLDVGVIWNFNAVLYTGKLDVVAAHMDCADVRVTVVGLTQSPQPQWRDAFLQWCDRPAALELFRRQGYGQAE